MSFKKNNIKKSSPVILNSVGIVALFIIFLLGLIIIKNTPFFDLKNDNEIVSSTGIILNTNSSEILNKNDIKNNQLEKETNKIKAFIKDKNDKDKINILVVGRGGGDHDAPNLTDTIILTSINTKTELISMLSIPRDLYVEYPALSKSESDDEKKDSGKINGLYAKYKFENDSKKVLMNTLKRKVTELTGEKIDYFINIDFAGFREIIDTIGGIEINIPEPFVDDRYPDGNWGYRTLIFKKGTWIFDGDNALKYARSRHSTSDFDRSIRQQQVIKAIKDKLTGSYFFTSPGKIKELYEVFNSHVYTDIKLSTLIKLAYTLNSSSEYQILSSNLNDSCFYGSETCEKGGFLYTPNRSYFGGMSVLLAEGTNAEKLNNYSILHEYTDIVFNSSELFKENYKINIFNSLKVNHLAGRLSNDIVRYGFNIPKINSIGNTQTTYSGSIIYYNNIDINSKTISTLKKFTNVDFIETKFPKYSNDEANIEIIIGEDYLSENNPFKF